MIRAISYALFGTAPIYLQGALRNAEQYPKFFPGWRTVFYIEEESVPVGTIEDLIDRDAEVRMYSRAEYPNGMFKRFCIADDPNVERFIVRDVDSRPSAREVNAVEAWVKSGLSGHIMRDHPLHCSVMMGGLWGVTRGVLHNVEQAIKANRRSKFAYSRATQYGADQEFLVSFVWPKIRTRSLIHDSFCRHGMTGVPFPDGLKEGDFVGSIFSSTDEPNEEHLKIRNDWIRGVR